METMHLTRSVCYIVCEAGIYFVGVVQIDNAPTPWHNYVIAKSELALKKQQL